tara:strand:+ start:414 stop:836 length:423 start_codon:yes stop_codon:yes gene_type:complete
LIKGINDIVAKNSIKELLNLNWGHYNLYVVGGLIQGWETNDIDIVVTGPILDYINFINLFNKANEISFIDISYHKKLIGIPLGDCTKMKPINIDIGRINKPSKNIDSYFENGVWFRRVTYPRPKQIKHKRVYTSHPMLIR